MFNLQSTLKFDYDISSCEDNFQRYSHSGNSDWLKFV